MADTEQLFASSDDALSPLELRDAWPVLALADRVEGFRLLPPGTADDFFVSLPASDQLELLGIFTPGERKTWIRILPPDDAADLLQSAPEELRPLLLAQLDDASRKEITALMAYAEDDAGGLMSTRFVRVRPELSTDEALAYLRRQAKEKVETVYYAYALDPHQRLLGVVSLRGLFQAPAGKQVSDIMRKADEMVVVPEQMDQEAVSRLIQEHDLNAVPVVDAEGRMKGIVTVDDIVDVVQEEATEDIHKVGGMAALDAPYFDTGFLSLLNKRAGWLTVLLLGEMLTATAMGYFEDELAKAIVLSLFIPLIISSGGNAGSQASTLIIRAMALGEMRLRDIARVFRREIATGLVLGIILGVVGFARVVVWQLFFGTFGEHSLRIGFTIAGSLVGCVLCGTLCGAMLPFALRRLNLDPASASAPLVATVVDVSGILIYFFVAGLFLRGALL